MSHDTVKFIEVDARGDSWRCSAQVPEDLIYFDGHFVGQPVLPAVAQLECLVLVACRRAWSDLGSLRALNRLKFRSQITRGELVKLQLERSAPHAVTFSIHRGDVLCSSGRLSFERSSP
jgi:3-hydroxymyristoyl/3-hydroxydecanoyl-(acyl carrier protein) dehydratase